MKFLVGIERLKVQELGQTMVEAQVEVLGGIKFGLFGLDDFGFYGLVVVGVS